MNTINLVNTSYDLPENWKEVKIENYKKITNIEEFVKSYGFDKFNEIKTISKTLIIEELSFLKEKPVFNKPEFTYELKKYKSIKFIDMTFDNFIDIMEYFNDINENLEKILEIIYGENIDNIPCYYWLNHFEKFINFIKETIEKYPKIFNNNKEEESDESDENNFNKSYKWFIMLNNISENIIDQWKILKLPFMFVLNYYTFKLSLEEYREMNKPVS